MQKTKKHHHKPTHTHTSLQGSPLWLSCSSPRPCTGTERCHRWCFSEGHFQSGIGFPGNRHTHRVQQDQFTGSYAWVHIDFMEYFITFLGSMLNFFRPMATCLFRCIFFLWKKNAFSSCKNLKCFVPRCCVSHFWT